MKEKFCDFAVLYTYSHYFIWVLKPITKSSIIKYSCIFETTVQYFLTYSPLSSIHFLTCYRSFKV